MKFLIFVLYFFVVSTLSRFCDARGRIFLRLKSFSNPDGVGDNGHICEGKNFLHIFVKDECDHFFEICLESFDGNSCDLGRRETPAIHNARNIVFGDKIGYMPNPLTFDMAKGYFQVKIMAYDEDPNAPDRVGHFGTVISRLPTGMNGRIPSRLTRILKGKRKLKFEFEIWAVCDRGYYGKECNIHCTPQNSLKSGFYKCNETTGEKICMKTFKGRNCLEKDFCASNPCKNGAKCINTLNNYACSCPKGYVGKQCERKEHPCRRIRCHNGGTCTLSDGRPKCVCSRGFIGTACGEDLDECFQAQPCLNNGTCENTLGSFRCICKAGFTGSRCGIAPFNSPQHSDKYEPPKVAEMKQDTSHQISDTFNQNWYYFVAGSVVAVLIVVALFVMVYRRRKFYFVKQQNNETVAFRASSQPCAEENVYLGDNDSDGTFYEDIDRDLEDAERESLEIDNCSDEAENDFENPSYNVPLKENDKENLH